MEADARRDAAPSPAQQVSSPSAKNRQTARRARAQERERISRVIRPLRKQLEEVESSIAKHEARKKEITAELENVSIAQDAEALRRLSGEYQQIDRETEELFTRWEELSTRVEHLLNAPQAEGGGADT